MSESLLLKNIKLKQNKKLIRNVISGDLAHVNYLIAGLLILVMIVLGVWIKFFVSWKRELDLNYDIDALAQNNGDPDVNIIDKNEPDEIMRDISEEEKKELTSEENSKSEVDARTSNCVTLDSENHSSYINNVNVIELKRL